MTGTRTRVTALGANSADRSAGSATQLHRLSVFGEDAREHELCATCRGLGMTSKAKRARGREGEGTCERCVWGEEPARASSSQRTLATGNPAHTGSLTPALPGPRRLRVLATTFGECASFTGAAPGVGGLRSTWPTTRERSGSIDGHWLEVLSHPAPLSSPIYPTTSPGG